MKLIIAALFGGTALAPAVLNPARPVDPCKIGTEVPS